MIPRKRLDIAWGDLLFAATRSLVGGDADALRTRIEKAWSADRTNLACLSVRSGFDALLTALALPPQSEVLLSAITIKDMASIVETHGLVPVPIDLDIATLAVRGESLARHVTARTRAILVAHLFGSRMNMQPIVEVARRHRLLVIEDCAQAFDGVYRGHAECDVHMFSFGTIKTATALGGAILSFRDRSLREKVERLQAAWPRQRGGRFLARVAKGAVLVLLSYRAIFTAFVAACRFMGQHHDTFIGRSVRGFAGGDFFLKIRRRPSYGLLALLHRRITRFDAESLARRMAAADEAIAALGWLKRPGASAREHTHWVVPILHPVPNQLIAHLWEQGFDATRGASSMVVVDPPAGRPKAEPGEAREAMRAIVYLPIYTGVSARDIRRLAKAIKAFDEGKYALAPVSSADGLRLRR